MTVEALGQVLDVLAWISAKGTLVSAAAANRVADGLANVVAGVGVLDPAYAIPPPGALPPPPPPPGAFDDTPDAPASALLQRVVEILGFLASSIGQGLTVPDERAVYVTSNVFQVRRLLTRGKCQGVMLVSRQRSFRRQRSAENSEPQDTLPCALTFASLFAAGCPVPIHRKKLVFGVNTVHGSGERVGLQSALRVRRAVACSGGSS